MKNNIIQSIIWKGNSLDILDQRSLPSQKNYITLYNLEEVIDCIRKMVVRGAPAIAISGIYGICLYLNSLTTKKNYENFQSKLNILLDSRPTAVNLKFAIQGLENLLKDQWEQLPISDIKILTLDYANRLFNEDIEINSKISENGSKLFNEKKQIRLITHCNTGSIATAGIGTALGIIKYIKNSGIDVLVYVSETRPYHQGSRLTSWELLEEGIDHYIIADSMSGFVMKNYSIDAVLVGADRIARNGDTANKIGTYTHAILAKHHNVPFYVAGSKYSFDMNLENGQGIKIEFRNADELTQNSFLKDSNGKNYIPEGILAPKNAKALNPSFDITPSECITGIITENGIISPVTEENVKFCMNSK
jgi:methylthioribose-1-phosphate isomerase